jgi:hypothetical protein
MSFAPPPEITTTDAEAKKWASYCHFSALAGFLIPFGNFIGPIICWQQKKSDPFVDDQGKEALNFQISMFIYMFVSAILVLVIVGLLLLLVLGLASIVLPIIAGIKAGEGTAYRYPFIIRFIK